MEKLDIEKFNPTKAEISTVVAKYKNLTIKDIDDKKGYALVDSGRKELKQIRVKIKKTGKELRSEALAFQRAVIGKEKELLELITPTIEVLEEKQSTIDNEKRIEMRKVLLPERLKKLDGLGLRYPDEFLLEMDSETFTAFYNKEHNKYLEEKGRKIEEEAREAREKAAEEAEKKRVEEEKRIKDEEDKLKKEREAIDAEKQKIEADKLAFEREKEEQIRLEKAKKEAAAEAKKEAEEKAEYEKHQAEAAEEAKVLAEKERKKQLETEKKYKDFLKKYGFEGESGNFHILESGKTISLYKRIGILEL